jgi:hypothetical protein
MVSQWLFGSPLAVYLEKSQSYAAPRIYACKLKDSPSSRVYIVPRLSLQAQLNGDMI